MRFSALVLSIFLGAVSAGPCRPSSVENSSETTGLIGVTTIESLSSTFAATVSTKPGGATTAAITSIVETTTESSAVAATTTAAASICNAPAALTCCQTVGTATNPVISLLLGLLGIVVQDPNTLLGATCSSITDPATCQATAVCCNDNSHGGLIAIGCSRV
ncbi:Fruiting body protein SC3 [Fusarium oxysporum f. sp. cubense]|uniref:Hydrophobin n=1 Tax=Fusarium oxysporum f. sp. cubense TaxID=61366 RepID=A0A559LRT5_FUSOC|nr:Fruiting body protein SC3 [Fusarium oxysporum f. sp. cubense]